VDVSSPVQIGALTNWSKVECGEGQCVAIKTDDTLWLWGQNDAGQLGIGAPLTDVLSPVQLGVYKYSKVVASASTTIAIRKS
jgi:alpha-tubulin suppressor-like RCC1 family protein